MNPFVLGYIRPEESLCDRKRETEELCRQARNSTHVVIASSRRLGKTSLMWRVLDDLHKEGFITVYADLLCATSKEIFVEKVASAITKGIGRSLPMESFIKVVRNLFGRIIPSIDLKPGVISISAKFDSAVSTQILIDDMFDSLEAYLKKNKKMCIIVFDEFQEITELPTGKEIEALLREKLQASRYISCFFVGSRRRVLEDMFNNKRRPFYKMTMLLNFGKIPREDVATYISDMFRKTKKECPLAVSQRIYDEVEGHTHYVQKLAHIVWNKTTKTTKESLVMESLDELLESEAGYFQAVWTNLGWTEKRVLMAISLESTSQPYASDFLSRHNLSIGSMQNGLKQLILSDIVERTSSNVYQPVDPILKKWCNMV